MKKSTLCFLQRQNRKNKEILLAMKKRGFGAGKWNGIGGKFDPAKGDKNIVNTAIRETKEEIGVKIERIKRYAVLDFYYPYFQKEKEWRVHVFIPSIWKGKPLETEEMKPKWFRIDEIPYHRMWDDDKFWLPLVLKGKRIKARFVFQKGESIKEHKIHPIKNFNEFLD